MSGISWEACPDGTKPPVWFALDERRPLAFFAGIWTRWTSVRKVKEGETTNDIFAFLTTKPNGVVAPIHPKAIVSLSPIIWDSRRSPKRSQRTAQTDRGRQKSSDQYC
jgi:putative SOS response-associated peptidase YedK